MTNSDKAEDNKVVSLATSPMNPSDTGILHPLSQALRMKESTPGENFKSAPVVVLTETPNVQHIPIKKEAKAPNTILEDIAAINKLFGE